MKKIKKVLPFGLAFLPLFAGAVANVNDLFNLTEEILGKVVPLLIGVAVVIILYAAVRYVTAAEDEEKKKNAKSMLIYAIVALFVMVSIWGLVSILTNTLSLDNDIPDIDVLPNF